MNETMHAKLREVDFIQLQFSDLFGRAKHIEVPSSEYEKVLNNDMMFDGSSIEGFASIEASDMYLKPDLSTWTVIESEPYRVGQFTCDIALPNGEPFIGDPRSNLKRILHKMEKFGFDTFNFGAEPEFFLLEKDGSRHDDADYFDLAPFDKGEVCRREITLALQKLGFRIEASHHEVAPGQHEVDFQYSDALTTCDRLQLFKTVVKKVAARYDLEATFMAKPFYGMNGSGMHANVSLFKEGKNMFYDEKSKEGLSDTAYQFIGGVLEHVYDFSAVTNPTVNSYKRLVPGFEAPSYIAWSTSNRTALIRIPASRGLGTRIEVRSVDPMANPYLAMTVILAAGLAGIEKKALATHRVDANIFHMTPEERKASDIQTLPSDLDHALIALEKSELMKEALGESIHTAYLRLKRQEWDGYRTMVHDWERAMYRNY